MSSIIATDKDGVLVDFVRPFLRYHNKYHNTNLRYEDVFSHDISRVLKITPEEANVRLDAFMNSSYSEEIMPIEGAVKAMHILTSKKKVHVITARPLHAKTKTLEYFSQYFPKFASVRFCEEFPAYLEFPDRTRKARFCEEFRPEFLFEDHAGNARDCAPYCGRVIVFNHPWNTHEPLSDNCDRVDIWPQALEIIN